MSQMTYWYLSINLEASVLSYFVHQFSLMKSPMCQDYLIKIKTLRKKNTLTEKSDNTWHFYLVRTGKPTLPALSVLPFPAGDSTGQICKDRRQRRFPRGEVPPARPLALKGGLVKSSPWESPPWTLMLLSPPTPHQLLAYIHWRGLATP